MAGKILVGQKCACGFKVRGENHEEGSHHRQGKKKPAKK